MKHIPKPTLVSSAVALMQFASKRKLVEMDNEEMERAVTAAVQCAKMIFEKSSQYGGLTLADLPTPASEPSHSVPEKPEWIRMPKGKSHCQYTGLSRSMLYALATPCQSNDYQPLVKSISLRRRGMQRGVRLISYDSLINYLAGLPSDERTGETRPDHED